MEYFNLETGTYYLRARYYDPTIGRFTQADTHWNTANMIYGDNPQTINQQQDALGLTSYTHVPQITAVAQSGNLYVYGISSPVTYIDRSGKTAELALAATAFVDPALGAAVFVVGAFIAVVGIIADAASKNGKPVTPVKPTGAASSPASPPPPNDDDKSSSKSYYKKGLRDIPDNWVEVESESYRVKSESFKEFLRNEGHNPRKWIKVVEKWASPDGTIYQRHYWTNGIEYFYHGGGIEVFIPH